MVGSLLRLHFFFTKNLASYMMYKCVIVPTRMLVKRLAQIRGFRKKILIFEEVLFDTSESKIIDTGNAVYTITSQLHNNIFFMVFLLLLLLLFFFFLVLNFYLFYFFLNSSKCYLHCCCASISRNRNIYKRSYLYYSHIITDIHYSSSSHFIIIYNVLFLLPFLGREDDCCG